MHESCLILASGNIPPWFAWLDHVQEIAPDHFTTCETCDRSDTPDALAVSIARGLEASGDRYGNLESYVTTRQIGDAIEANALVLDHEHGAVNAYRAAVDSLMRDTDRDPDVVARNVDPMEGARHSIRTRRNRKGNTVSEVTHYGAATVQGQWSTVDHTDMRQGMSEHLGEQYSRQMVLGRNALDVLRITQATYGPLLDTVSRGQDSSGRSRLVTLLGTDVEMWKETWNPADDPEAVSAPIVGRMVLERTVTPEGRSEQRLRTVDNDPNVAAPITLTRDGITRQIDLYHPSGRVVWLAHANCSHTDDVRRRADRMRLPRVNVRKAERALVEPVEIGNGQTRQTLMSSADRTDAAWIGHRLTKRTDHARRSPRQVKATRAKRAHLVEIATEQGWQVLIDDVPRDTRLTVRSGAWVVTINRSRSGKFNIRAKHPEHKAITIQSRTSTRPAKRLLALI